MIVQRYDTSLYVRTSWFRGNLDKVVRLRVGAGPVDFIQEKLIAGNTAPASTISAFATSTAVIRSGADEAPPAHIDGDWRGGNHPASVDYECAIWLDGKPLTAARGVWTGVQLDISETYAIPTEAAIDAGKAEPARASVAISRRFGADGFCRFGYSLTALRQLTLDYINGMQLLKPTNTANQTLKLFVPKSNLKNGVNVTSEAQQRLCPSTDWDSASVPPDLFEYRVMLGNVAQFGVVMAFNTGQVRGTPTTAFERSAAGKLYPRGYEGPLTMTPGMTRSVSGYFGSYNLIGT